MYIIVGQGAAGTAAARALRRHLPSAEVLIIGEDANGFYNRIALPDVIAGTVAPEAVALLGAQEFADLGIACRAETVTSLDKERHTLRLVNGEELEYEKLLLATGSLSAMPPIEGKDAAGVFSLWTLDDALAIAAAADKADAAVVIGAGLIGLKTALALKKRGLAVTVVEQMDRVMPRQLDDTASAMIAEGLRAQGVTVLTGETVRAIRSQNGRVSGVALGANETASRDLPCAMVIMAVGVSPNTRLAREAGLEVKRGIVTDAAMRTSDPDIYAAGDVAETVDILDGAPAVPAIWPVAVDQGTTAAAAMAGRNAAFDGSVAMNSVEVAGIALASVGDIMGNDRDTLDVDRTNTTYRRLVFRDGILRGALCVGDIGPIGILGAYVRQKRAFPDCDPLARRFNFGDILCSKGTRRNYSCV